MTLHPFVERQLVVFQGEIGEELVLGKQIVRDQLLVSEIDLGEFLLNRCVWNAYRCGSR